MIVLNNIYQVNYKSRGGTGTWRLPDSGRVLHYPALTGPGWVLL